MYQKPAVSFLSLIVSAAAVICSAPAMAAQGYSFPPHLAHVGSDSSAAVNPSGAQNPAGYIVDARQESLVSPGMSIAEVEQALGHPLRTYQFRNQEGVTLSYQAGSKPTVVFEVDFDRAGQVTAATERIVPMGRI